MGLTQQRAIRAQVPVPIMDETKPQPLTSRKMKTFGPVDLLSNSVANKKSFAWRTKPKATAKGLTERLR
jgi:hypothetical protein